MNCGNFPFGETFHSEQTMSETYECVEWAWLNDTDIDHARNETGFKFSKGRIPWQETEVKRITSEIITQSRRANSVIP